MPNSNKIKYLQGSKRIFFFFFFFAVGVGGKCLGCQKSFWGDPLTFTKATPCKKKLKKRPEISDASFEELSAYYMLITYRF